MAFDIRCPECQAKLRLDETPDPNTPIECPRCGSQFDPPAAKASAKAKEDRPPVDKPKRKEGGDKKKKGPPAEGKIGKKIRQKKKKTNPVFLLAAIGVGFAGLIGVGILLIWFVNRAGKVEELLGVVPEECNWTRGVNVGQLSRLPGYKAELKKYMTDPVQAGSDELAKAAGLDAEKFLDYLVIGKSRSGGPPGDIYVFRSQKAMVSPGKNLTGATEQSVNGEVVYKMPASAPGVLSNAVVYYPMPKVAVVVPPSAGQANLIRGAVAGKGNKSATVAGKLNATARVVIRGGIWLLLRPAGPTKDWMTETTTGISKDMKSVADSTKSVGMFGLWSTPGGTGVRFGAAVECASAKDASDFVKAMKNGPLGKGDESEPPNSLKQFRLFSDKKAASEFLQNLSFQSRGECAFLVSMLSGEATRVGLDIFNNPTTGTGDAAPQY